MRLALAIVALIVLGQPILTLGRVVVAPGVASVIDSESAFNIPPPSQPADPLRPATTKRLNIVMLVIDDLAELDTRVWERLPNIRAAFLENGLRFTHYSGNDPLCCPGRASLLTGLWSQHHGVVVNDASLFHPQETIATELHDQGYYTAIAGKYFNGTNRLASKTPPGWDHASIYSGGYYRYSMWDDGVREYHDNDRNDYSTDIIANKALRYLRAAPPDKPLFAYLAPYAVHAGDDRFGHSPKYMPSPADRFIGDPRCADIAPWRPANYNEADVADKPDYISGLPRLAYTDGWPMGRTCRTLLAVDEMLGRVRAELAAQGRLENTLFVMTADNGMAFGAHRWPKKRVPYSTPMPLFMSWAKGLGTGASVNPVFLANVDMAPTLCGLAGCRLHDYPTGQAKPDGLDLSQQISRSPPAEPKRTILFEGRPGRYYYEAGAGGAGSDQFGQDHPWRAIRTTDGVWHYVGYATGEQELYDLVADPYELSNLAAQPAYAKILKVFRRRADAIIADTPNLAPFVIPARLGAPAPTPTPTARPTPEPTAPPTPTPTVSPSSGPTVSPMTSPSPEPTADATPAPTASLTPTPVEQGPDTSVAALAALVVVMLIIGAIALGRLGRGRASQR